MAVRPDVAGPVLTSSPHPAVTSAACYDVTHVPWCRGGGGGAVGTGDEGEGGGVGADEHTHVGGTAIVHR